MCGVVLPITLGANLASISAIRTLGKSSERLSSVFERLSSGQRINRASDDAAGLAVSSSLHVRTRVYNQGIRNLNDGVSALNIADQAIANLSDIVTRQTELAAQAANGIYSTTQRAAMDREAQALNQEYSRIVSTTQFNGIKLIDGTASGVNLQAGFGTSGNIAANILGPGTINVDNGTTTDTSITLNDLGGGLSANRFLIGDLNGDGIADIVSLSTTHDGLQEVGEFNLGVYLGSATGTFTYANGLSADYSYSGELMTVTLISANMLDYTGDGKLDIRVRYLAQSDLGSVNINEREQFNNTTSGGIFSMDFSNDDSLSPTSDALTSGGVSVADFNGDGIADNLTATASGFTIGIHNTSSVISNSTIDDLSQSAFSLATQSGARSALTSLGTLATELSQDRGRIGASLSRMASATAVLQTTATNYAAANSQILSADVASDSAELTKSTILQNVGSAVLAQANQQPGIALMLLRN